MLYGVFAFNLHPESPKNGPKISFNLMSVWSPYLSHSALLGDPLEQRKNNLFIRSSTLLCCDSILHPLEICLSIFTNNQADSFINLWDPLCESKVKHQFSYQQSMGSCWEAWDSIIIGELNDSLRLSLKKGQWNNILEQSFKEGRGQRGRLISGLSSLTEDMSV